MGARAWSRLITATAMLLCLTGVDATPTGLAESSVSVNDQSRLSLTIYNGSISLVHDRRRVALHNGLNHVAWRDVSAQMEPTSALLDDLSAANAVRVVEQNFDADLLRPSAILARYVGHDVVVVHDKPAPGQPARETARLLSVNEGIVLRYADRIETTLVDSHLAFPAIPINLRSDPTLVLDLDARSNASADLDLNYLTGGLAWHADYVGSIAPDERHMNLRGLVTLSNSTGVTYNNAHLQLVAGNVNVAAEPSEVQLRGFARAMPAPTPTPGFSQENYFEYHLYTLDRPTTIENAQTKQVALLSARDVPVQKTLELRGSDYYYRSASRDLGTKIQVGVYVTFTNKGGDLGIPLPRGLVRLYKNDSRGSSLFLGSDRIDHTPRNQDVRLHVGDSFDVTANRKQTDFHLVALCTYESSYRVDVSNAKDEPADVLVVEPIPGDWQITSESVAHVKSSSQTANWSVHVRPNATTTLTYTVHSRFCAGG